VLRPQRREDLKKIFVKFYKTKKLARFYSWKNKKKLLKFTKTKKCIKSKDFVAKLSKVWNYFEFYRPVMSVTSQSLYQTLRDFLFSPAQPKVAAPPLR